MNRVDVPGVMIEGYNYSGKSTLVKDDPAWTVLYSDELGPQELSDRVMELFPAAYCAAGQNARSPE